MQLRWALALMILAALIGMLVSTGATAALAFPTVKKIGVIVPAWSSDSQAWKLVAGLPMQQAFAMNDRVAALGTLITCVLVWPRKGELSSHSHRGLRIALAFLLAVIVGEFALHSRMLTLLNDIQASNVAGLSDQATQGHLAFSKLHPIATGLMGLRMLLLLISCVCIMVVLAPQAWAKSTRQVSGAA